MVEALANAMYTTSVPRALLNSFSSVRMARTKGSYPRPRPTRPVSNKWSNCKNVPIDAGHCKCMDEGGIVRIGQCLACRTLRQLRNLTKSRVGRGTTLRSLRQRERPVQRRLLPEFDEFHEPIPHPPLVSTGNSDGCNNPRDLEDQRDSSVHNSAALGQERGRQKTGKRTAMPVSVVPVAAGSDASAMPSSALPASARNIPIIDLTIIQYKRISLKRKR